MVTVALELLIWLDMERISSRRETGRNRREMANRANGNQLCSPDFVDPLPMDFFSRHSSKRVFHQFKSLAAHLECQSVQRQPISSPSRSPPNKSYMTIEDSLWDVRRNSGGVLLLV